jgi:lipopolysaccharide export system protein LptC
MGAVARYTRFVALFKRFLWVLITIIIALLVWIASDMSDDKARIVFAGITKSEALQNIMQSPFYQGVDTKNRPYTIIAETATQLDKETVVLHKIHADMMVSEGVWVAMTAGEGEMNIKNKQLALQSGVDIFYDKGFEFRTDHANIDITKGSAYADSAVEGQGAMGTIKADRFSATQHGNIMRFEGNVVVKLYR